MLELTNGQLFVIGYRSILNKIEALEPTDWAYNRITYFGESETTLPKNYLTGNEKRELFAWALAQKDGESEDGKMRRARANEASDEDLERYEEQSFGLFGYPRKTMTRCDERGTAELKNEVIFGLLVSPSPRDGETLKIGQSRRKALGAILGSNEDLRPRDIVANKFHGMAIRESLRWSGTLCSQERDYQADLLGGCEAMWCLGC